MKRSPMNSLDGLVARLDALVEKKKAEKQAWLDLETRKTERREAKIVTINEHLPQLNFENFSAN